MARYSEKHISMRDSWEDATSSNIIFMYVCLESIYMAIYMGWVVTLVTWDILAKSRFRIHDFGKGPWSNGSLVTCGHVGEPGGGEKLQLTGDEHWPPGRFYWNWVSSLCSFIFWFCLSFLGCKACKSILQHYRFWSVFWWLLSICLVIGLAVWKSVYQLL